MTVTEEDAPAPDGTVVPQDARPGPRPPDRPPPGPDGGGPPPTRPWLGVATVVALLVWAGLLVGVRLWGLDVLRAAEATGRGISLGAVPLSGTWEWHVPPAASLAIALAVFGVLFGPTLADRLPWRWLLVVAGAAHAGWVVALGLFDGWSGMSRSLASRHDYLAGVPLVGSPGGFLRDFTSEIGSYPTHVRSHPPGLVLGFWGLDEVGLGGPVPAIVLVVLAGAVATAAVLVALREVSEEGLARRAAPFVALAPAAVWATNADAIFAGVGAAGVALVVLATGRSGRRADVLAVAGGAVLGLALLLAYGLVLLALPALAVIVARRRIRLLVVSALAGAAAVALPALWGFWWLEGLGATRSEYWDGVAQNRPFSYFVVANLAVFALALGPAVVAGLLRLRDRGAWLLVGGALAAVVVANLSGLSKGEVERIWQPFMFFVLPAAGALARRWTPSWLGAQVTLTFGLEAALRSPW